MSSAPAAAGAPAAPGTVVPLFRRRDGDKLRLALVEDHELLGQILVTAFTGRGVEARHVYAETGTDILASLAGFAPDVVLLDVDLGDPVGSGVELIAPIREIGAAVVMLTGSKDRLTFAECLEAGALGFVNKDVSFDRLSAAVASAAAGEPLVTETERQDLLAELRANRALDRSHRQPFERLTPRERQVLAALMEGLSATEIASTSFVSVATVRSQIRSVLVKLGVTSQLAAVAMARKGHWFG